MAYRLKQGQPPIQVTDGPMARKRFLPGREYCEIPEAEKHRFTEVKKAKASADKTGGSK